MISEKDLRTWLMGVPRPAKILVTDGDGERLQVAGPSAKGGGNNWTRLARTILTMKPSRIELYDAAEVLLRVMRPEDEEAVETSKIDTAAIGPVMHHDPETARLTHFANLLYRATEFSIGTAFTKMVQLFEIQAERTIALEARLERAEAQYHRVVKDRIEEQLERSEDILEAAAATTAQQGANGSDFTGPFLQGLMTAAAEKPNHHKPKETKP